jgi:hypothetical protein
MVIPVALYPEGDAEGLGTGAGSRFEVSPLERTTLVPWNGHDSVEHRRVYIDFF